MGLGWAIIGTGRHSEDKIAPAVNASPTEDLVAVFSRDQERAEAFARQHGAQTAYNDLDDLLRDSRVEAVFVTSPNHLHAEHTIKAAQAGKHVLCEKTMALGVEDAAAMARTCRERGVKLGVGFNMRQHPGNKKLRQVIAGGEMGEVRLVHASRALGQRGKDGDEVRTGPRGWWLNPELVGGAYVMMTTGVHIFDQMRYLLGQEVTHVSAFTDGQTAAQPLEQLAQISLRMSGGAIANLVVARNIPDCPDEIAIYCRNGRLRGQGTLNAPQMPGASVEILSNPCVETSTYPGNYLGNYVAELEDFHQAIEQDRDPLASGMDGLRVVEITQAAIESARHNRTVAVTRLEI